MFEFVIGPTLTKEIIPSSILCPSPAAALSITRINPQAFQVGWITSMSISRHVKIICSF
jgi:hypothetical protein